MRNAAALVRLAYQRRMPLGFRFQLANEDGFTLMEMMITVAILGILCAVGASLMTALFDSQIRQGQMLDQQTTIETYYGFMAAHLSPAQRPLGLVKNDGTVDPRSIANDQIVFQSAGNCYRVFWIGPDVPNRSTVTTEQIRATVAADCSKQPIRPVRGPNEPPADDDNGDGFAEPDDADFDIAIDSLAPNWSVACQAAMTPWLSNPCGWSSIQLAAGVVKQRPPYAPAGTPPELVPFSFVGDNGTPVVGMAQKAGVGPVGNFYSSSSGASAIASIDATAYIKAMAATNSSRVSDRYYEQNFSLQQVCVLPGGGASGFQLGTDGGDVSGNTNQPVINQGAVTSSKVADDSLTANDLGPSSVGTSELGNGSVTSAKLAISTGEATLSANRTLTASEADVSGLSLGTLPAGTYLIRVYTTMQIVTAAGGTSSGVLYLNINGTNDARSVLAFNGVPNTNTWFPASMEWRVTLPSAQTVKIRGLRGDFGNAGAVSLLATSTVLTYERVG